MSVRVSLPQTIMPRRRVRPWNQPTVPCIGGPLDGQQIASGERRHIHKQGAVEHVYEARVDGGRWSYVYVPGRVA